MALILSVVLLGVSASLSPATIIVFIVVLGTTRAKVNAAAFLAGWTASVAVVFAASYLLGSSPRIQEGPPRAVVLTLEVLLGCFLLILGGRRWRHRAAESERTGELGPRVLADRVNGMGPRTAAMLGVLKEPWAITAAAAAVVVHHHATPIVTVLAFVLFAISSTASVGVMYLYYERSPEEAETRLTDLRGRVTAAGPAMFAVGAMVVGAFLLLDGLIGVLSS